MLDVKNLCGGGIFKGKILLIADLQNSIIRIWSFQRLVVRTPLNEYAHINVELGNYWEGGIAGTEKMHLHESDLFDQIGQSIFLSFCVFSDHFHTATKVNVDDLDIEAVILENPSELHAFLPSVLRNMGVPKEDVVSIRHDIIDKFK